jgi:hypothetical protein
MSEIKQVQMSMPVLTKTGRKSRKGVKRGLDEVPVQQQQGIVGVAPGAVAAVAAVAGGAGAGAVTRKQPLVLQQKKQLLQPQQGGVSSTTAVNVPVIMINAKVLPQQQQQQPMPALSTTSVVGGKNKEAPSDKKKIVLAKKAITVKAPPVKTPTLQIQPKPRNNKTLKKSYSAKRITIHMENPKNVRKTRDAVRRNIANMTLDEITEKLRQRGLVRPEACPPEHIQRLMMIDIELFPAPI